MAYKAIEKGIHVLTPFEKVDLSDVIENTTREQIQVSFWHRNSYWKYGDWTLATEAVAEMLDSIIFNQESLLAIYSIHIRYSWICLMI